jgi:ribosomal protein L22
MATTFQKQVKQAILDNTMPDHIICKRDGSVTVKKSYFYRMGRTPEKLAAGIEQALASANITANVQAYDAFAQWPKTSYLVAEIREH